MKSKKNTFPSQKVLERVREKFSDPDFIDGNIALSTNASEVDRAKYQVCQLIAKYKREHGWKQREIADQLGIDEARISHLLKGRIEGFTLDRLIGYVEKLHPGLKVKIIAA